MHLALGTLYTSICPTWGLYDHVTPSPSPALYDHSLDTPGVCHTGHQGHHYGKQYPSFAFVNLIGHSPAHLRVLPNRSPHWLFCIKSLTPNLPSLPCHIFVVSLNMCFSTTMLPDC